MGVGKELLGVLLNLSDSEPNTSVLSLHDNTSAEGPLKAADSVPALLVTDGIGEGNAGMRVSSLIIERF